MGHQKNVPKFIGQYSKNQNNTFTDSAFLSCLFYEHFLFQMFYR